MQIAIPLFDRFTALDAVGPFEVLSRLPDATVTFIATGPGPVRNETRSLALVADVSFEEIPAPDVVVVPGGIGSRAMMRNETMLAWIRDAHRGTRWTISVCTGALILAGAGLLDGVDAATHWLARDTLAELGANPVTERVVERGKIITAAGVSAGIDMALTLAARIAGDDVAQSIQLSIEYDPAPPFDTGSPETAPAHVVELALQAQAQRRRSAGVA